MSRLVLRFAVYAGVAVALAGVASVLVGRHLATERAQQQAWSDAKAIARELGRDDLARAALERPAFGDVRAELDELFGRVALGPNVVRVSLFDRGGRVTYSTEHSLIGTTSPEEEKLADALAGKSVFGVAELDGGKVIESYVPVHWLLADPGWPAGVLAVHRDHAPVAEEIADQTRLQAAAVLLALVLLYVALFPILDRVTRKLARSEARYRALTEQASDAILVCDPRGEILEANTQAAVLLGVREGTLVGVSFADLVDPDELARTPLRLPELREGKVVLLERTLVRADGESVIAEVHAKMLEDGRILASLRDVTGRREAEGAIRKAERAEATTRLAAGVAHDFSDLLTRIAGDSDLILARLPEGDPLRRNAELIQEAAARGAELTGQLLAFGRRRTAEPVVVDLTVLFSELEWSLARIAGAGVELELDIEPGLGQVEADRAQLRELVLSLVSAARDAMPTGGTLRIAAANVELERQGAHVEPGQYVMLAISETSGSEGDRLALGLASVYGLVHRGGGTIGVETEPGVGTTVRIYLPRVDGVTPEEPPAELGGSETILVVEDEHVVRALVREILEDEGYSVVDAADGRAGLEVATTQPVDLVLTDLVMPELAGQDLVAELERIRPNCRIVLMSAYEADVNGRPFLQKPFTHETLARTIRETLDLPAH